MTKKSFFSLSPSLLKEDFRKYWAIPALGFVAFFFTCVFPIILRYGQLSNENYSVSRNISGMLSNSWPAAICIYLIIPILSAMLIFRYLHVPGPVTLVHGLPFTRSQLLNSHFLSAALFCIVPLVLNGIILLLIATPVYELVYVNGIQTDMINVFTGAAIMKWMGEGILIMLFTLVISVFAGMVTGTSLHHFLGAVGFNGLAPLIYTICIFYFQKYLYGYTADSNQYEFLYNLSPVASGARITPISPFVIAMYIVTILIFYAVTMYLYYRRRLERATEGTVFKSMDVFLTILISFLGMTAMGMFFDSISDGSPGMVYMGYAVGAAIFLLIGRFLLKKTVRIFNRATGFLALAYTIMALLFISGLRFDFTGFESRVPDPQRVSSAYGEVYLMNSNYYYEKKINNYEDPENIQHLLNFHRRIADNKEWLKDSSQDNWVISRSVSLKYYDEKKQSEDDRYILSRVFSIPYSFILEDKNLKGFYESEEYRDKNSISHLLEKDLYNIDLESFHSSLTPLSSMDNYDNRRINGEDNLRSFVAAYEKDIRKATFEELSSPKPAYGHASLSYKEQEPDSDRIMDYQMSITILQSYTNTIKWMEDHGYRTSMEIDPSRLRAAVIRKITLNPGEEWFPEMEKPQTRAVKEIKENPVYDPLPAETASQMVITDPEKIKHLALNSDQGILYPGEYYTLSIITTDEYWHEGRISGYFTHDNLPDYVKEYYT